MLDLVLELSAILAIRPRSAAEICEQALDVTGLVTGLDDGDPFTRKGLCEYLGIGESTLSGWIKDGRIPRMAKNAIVLLAVQQELAAEVRRLQLQLDAAITDLKVVRSGQHYQVCELQEDEEGEVIGRVIADQIATLEDARLLASGRRALRLLKHTEDSGIFEYVNEVCDNQAFLSDVEAAEEELEAHKLFLSDYPKWKAKFGKKARAHIFDDLIADGKPTEEDKP